MVEHLVSKPRLLQTRPNPRQRRRNNNGACPPIVTQVGVSGYPWTQKTGFIMYKPLPDFLELKDSAIHGLGLFAAEDIKKNICLGVTHIKDERFEDSYIRTPLGAFFNHSNNPNVDIVSVGDWLVIVTKKKILKGEEIIAKYNLYNPCRATSKRLRHARSTNQCTR